MQRGDIVKLICSGGNLGMPWPMGGPGVYTITNKFGNRRWFPNGTHGLVMGKTYPGAPGAAMYIYDIMIEGEIFPVDNQYLRGIE
jgi:hypothetical protein